MFPNDPGPEVQTDLRRIAIKLLDLEAELARVKEAVRHHPLAADGSVITLGSRWTTRSLYADSLPGEMIEVVVTSVGHTTVRAATNGRELDLPYLPENLHPLTTALVDRARKEKQ